METYKNLKKGTKVGLIVSLAILAASLSCNLIRMFVNLDQVPESVMIHMAINLIMMALVFFYAFVGYKKPHGNALRYTHLVFALLVMVQGVIPSLPDGNRLNYLVSGTAGVAAVLIAYIGARLHKMKQNVILMAVAGASLLASILILEFTFPVFDAFQMIGAFAQFACYAALCFAYVARYEEHKAAGLADKADVEEN